MRKSYERINAQILMLSDESEEGISYKDEETAQILNIHIRTAERTRKKFVLEGLEETLKRAKPSKTKPKIIDGVAEAKLIALACSKAPEGRAYWTLSLLSKKMVELDYVEKVSKETVRRTLKKMNLNLGKPSHGA